MAAADAIERREVHRYPGPRSLYGADLPFGAGLADSALLREQLLERNRETGEQRRLEHLGVFPPIGTAAGASIRTQLLTVRLQLQEQRVYTAARQLASAQKVLETSRQEIAGRRRQIDRVQEEVLGATGDRLQVLRDFLATSQAALEDMKKQEEVLRVQETELVNTLAIEQDRWTESSSRLDEIEQSLPTPRR